MMKIVDPKNEDIVKVFRTSYAKTNIFNNLRGEFIANAVKRAYNEVYESYWMDMNTFLSIVLNKYQMELIATSQQLNAEGMMNGVREGDMFIEALVNRVDEYRANYKYVQVIYD